MKLSDLKKELEKRSLPITGTKMTLELRLKASREWDQKSINIPIPAAATPLISRANASGRTVSMDRGQEKPGLVTVSRYFLTCLFFSCKKSHSIDSSYFSILSTNT